jgi:signal transduction histidine kinase
MTRAARIDRQVAAALDAGTASRRACAEAHDFYDDAPDAVPSDADCMRLSAELAPGIGHDIRNMLSIIVNRAELARRRGPADANAALEAIAAVARSASGLTDILMHIAGLKPRAATSETILNLNLRLVALLPILERIIPDNALRLSFASSNLWLVRANAAQFDAAILNLIINARDALRGTGMADARILIRTRNVRCAGQNGQEADHVLVSVADSGPGMDAATLARAWEPFFTTKGEQGTGLGLDQVRRFAETAGGRARIRSAPGRGTTVQLLLPRAVEAVAVPAMPSLAGQASAIPHGIGQPVVTTGPKQGRIP